MAQIEDPAKVFQFGFIAPGLNPYLVQEVDIPDYEFDKVEHGDIISDVKTAGRAKFSDITMKNLRPVSQYDGQNWIWDWINGMVDIDAGSIQNPINYKKNADIVQYDYDMVTITDRWTNSGLFPVKVNGMKLRRMSSENMLDEIVLSVDKSKKIL